MIDIMTQMEIIADECNARRVVATADDGQYVLVFDTVKRETVSFTFTKVGAKK